MEEPLPVFPGKASHTEARPLFGQKMKITAKQFIAFFDEKTDTSGCPFCGTKSWNITIPADASDDDDDQIIDIQELGLEQFELGETLMRKGEALLIIHMICDGCGFVRLHSSNLIKTWLQTYTESTE